MRPLCYCCCQPIHCRDTSITRTSFSFLSGPGPSIFLSCPWSGGRSPRRRRSASLQQRVCCRNIIASCFFFLALPRRSSTRSGAGITGPRRPICRSPFASRRWLRTSGGSRRTISRPYDMPRASGISRPSGSTRMSSPSRWDAPP